MPTYAVNTHVFRFHTAATREQVWDVLTAGHDTCRFLNGLALDTAWDAGGPISVRHGATAVMTGEVLLAERPARLSYTLASQPAEPPAYLTWELRDAPGGTIVRLTVDELDTGGEAEVEEVEEAWLPVVGALHDLGSPSPVQEQPR